MEPIKLALFDFDGTLIKGDSIIAYLRLARHLKAVSLPRFLGILLRAPLYAVGLLSDAAYKTHSLQFYAGLSPERKVALDRVFVDEVLLPNLFKQGKAALEAKKQEGYHVLLLSASTENYMQHVAKALQVDGLICTKLDAQARVTENCKGEMKVQLLKRYLKEKEMDYTVIGTVSEEAAFVYGDVKITMDEALAAWTSKLEKVFPTKAVKDMDAVNSDVYKADSIYVCKNKVAKPTVFIPVFPGTNCEYDSTKAFEKAGAKVITRVFKNHTAEDIRSSVEAFEKDIFTGIGSVEHHADKLIDRQIFRRTSELDTMYMPEGGIYCWNPHPFEHKTVMGFNGFADPNRNGVFFNVLRDEDGNEIPLQFLPSDSTFGPFGDAWGKITAVIDLPPTGEKTFAYGVSAKDYPKVGFERQKKLLKNLALEVFFDNTRTWGFDLIQINNKLGNMELVHTEEYCNGPVCSILRAVYRFRNSEVRLDIYDYIGIQEIGVKVRLDWQETMSCMKLSWAHKCVNPDFYTGSCAAAVCRLSKNDYGPAKEWSNGSMITKLPSTQEFSMIDWCAAAADGKIAAFFAADIHSCDHADNRMRLTLVRPVLYADHAPFARKDDDGWMDLGIGFRSFWIAEYDQLPLSSLQKKSIARLNNGEVREITAHEAGDPRGYCEFMKFELAEEQLTVQELRRNDDCETEIRLLNSGEAISLNLPEIGKTEIPAFALRTFKWKNNDISADA